MRRENNGWLGCNSNYKYHSKDTHFRWKAAGAFGALGIMGEMRQAKGVV